MQKVTVLKFKLESKKQDENLVDEIHVMKKCFLQLSLVFLGRLFPHLKSSEIKKRYKLVRRFERIGSFYWYVLYVEVLEGSIDSPDNAQVLKDVSRLLKNFGVHVKALSAVYNAKKLKVLASDTPNTKEALYVDNEFIKKIFNILIKNYVGSKYDIHMMFLGSGEIYHVPSLMKAPASSEKEGELIGYIQSLSYTENYLYFIEDDEYRKSKNKQKLDYEVKSSNEDDATLIKFRAPHVGRLILITESTRMQMIRDFHKDPSLTKACYVLKVMRHKKYSYGIETNGDYTALITYKVHDPELPGMSEAECYS